MVSQLSETGKDVAMPRHAKSLGVFITGSASGIGLHVTGRLLAQGHRVWATDLRRDALEAAAKTHNWPESLVTLAGLDVVDEPGWQTTYEQAIASLGGIDVHLNIAGFLRPAWVAEATSQDVHRHLDINVKGVVFGTQQAARHMTDRGHGHIINIASLASLSPVPGLSLYSASKFAVRAYSVAAALELRDHGVAVTTICPDAVQTPMLDLQVGHEEASLTFSGNRALTVEEVGRAIERALAKRPIEIHLPRSRAWLAKVANLMPQLSSSIQKRLQARGRARQADIRSRDPSSST